MALQSAFRKRLEQMECTRNQRLSLLQSEKELQINKSRDLASKLSDIRSIEQRCLKLDGKIASQHLIISSLKSELHCLDSVYCEVLQQIRKRNISDCNHRKLKLEVEELEELEKEKESHYNTQSREMEDFKAEVKIHVANCQVHVQELRTEANELKSSFTKIQGSVNYSNNSEITLAEATKAELLAEKDGLDKILVSKYQIRDQLRKQLQTILADQDQRRKK